VNVLNKRCKVPTASTAQWSNWAICRTFLWAVWLLVIDRQSMVIARHDEYRPRIDLLEMSSFVGLSPE
jgi:hypothetical protein